MEDGTEYDHDYDDMSDDDSECETECPYCDDGWQRIDGMAVECGECGGTGWY